MEVTNYLLTGMTLQAGPESWRVFCTGEVDRVEFGSFRNVIRVRKSNESVLLTQSVQWLDPEKKRSPFELNGENFP